jgi:hypothetical protein
MSWSEIRSIVSREAVPSNVLAALFHVKQFSFGGFL